MENDDFNRNPKGNNQWVLRSDDVIQKIINKYPAWTKKDFTGEGKLNPNKKDALLTKTECEREKLVFGHVGKRRRPLKEIYKLSTKENISRFENKEIDEDTFRKNALAKSYRDKMSQSEKKKINNKESFPSVSLSVKNPVSSKILVGMIFLQVLSNIGILYFLFVGME